MSNELEQIQALARIPAADDGWPDWKEASEGDAKLAIDLLQRDLPFCESVIRKTSRASGLQDVDDPRSEAVRVVYRAAQRYDQSNGLWGPFLGKCIMNKVRDHARQARRGAGQGTSAKLTYKVCMMNLQTLRSALGGEIVGRQLLCPGPGHSPRDRPLSITISPGSATGFLVYSFAGDDWRVCQSYVCERAGIDKWEPGDDRNRRVSDPRRFDSAFVDHEAAECREPTEEDRQRIARAVDIWTQGVDPRGTLVEKYLTEERALYLPDTIAGATLRYHPHCPWRDENVGRTIFIPAMIAAFRSIDTDQITAIHRILLTPDGRKIGRKMYGPTRRAAVKLDSAGETLAIAEGIETAMAARELGIAAPTWALGSAGAISTFPVIDGVKTLIIIGEAGEASADAIEFCRPRWIAAGRDVKVVMPDTPHSDLNDELIHNMRRPAA